MWQASLLINYCLVVYSLLRVSRPNFKKQIVRNALSELLLDSFLFLAAKTPTEHAVHKQKGDSRMRPVYSSERNGASPEMMCVLLYKAYKPQQFVKRGVRLL